MAYFEEFSRRKEPDEVPAKGIRCIITDELEKQVATPETVEHITTLEAVKAFYMPFYKDTSGHYFEPPVCAKPYASEGVHPLKVIDLVQANDHPDFPIEPIDPLKSLHLPAFRLSDAIILLDGNHKAVNLVRQNAEKVHIDLTIVDLPLDLAEPHKIHPGLLIFYRHFALRA